MPVLFEPFLTTIALAVVVVVISCLVIMFITTRIFNPSSFWQKCHEEEINDLKEDHEKAMLEMRRLAEAIDEDRREEMFLKNGLQSKLDIAEATVKSLKEMYESSQRELRELKANYVKELQKDMDELFTTCDVGVHISEQQSVVRLYPYPGCSFEHQISSDTYELIKKQVIESYEREKKRQKRVKVDWSPELSKIDHNTVGGTSELDIAAKELKEVSASMSKVMQEHSRKFLKQTKRKP